jgi:type I restriction enzyme S subunit
VTPTPLGECCEILSGATPKTTVADYWGGDILWATPADLSHLNGPFIDDTPRRLTAAGLTSCSAVVLPEGSVLLSSRAPIGHVAINTRPMATNQGFKSLVPRAGRVDAKYLYHWLRVNKDYLQSLGNGATFKELSKSVVERIEVPLPALNEQRRIAAILDQADALGSKRREILASLGDLAESIFLDMFGHESGEHVSVEQVVAPRAGSIRTGPFGSQLRHSEFVDEGIAVLGLDNVVSNEFKWGERRYITAEKYRRLQRYTVEPGDVLISIMGTCGRCVVVPAAIPTAINTKHICAISLDRSRALPEFVRAAFLWHPQVRRYLARQTKGSIMDGLNMGIIKRMPLPLPAIELQHEFVKRAQAVESQRLRADRLQRETDRLHSSLRERAFAGLL